MNSLFSIKNMCEDKLLDIYYLMYWRKCVQWTGPKNPDNIFKNCSIPTKAFNVPAIKQFMLVSRGPNMAQTQRHTSLGVF